MFKLILSLISFLFVIPSFAQQYCYNEVAGRTVEAYTIEFTENIGLVQNRSGNYNIRLQAGRRYGCIIFSKVQNLSGKYYSAQTEYLVANKKCEGKKDYAYVQFVNERQEEVFRVQCEYPVYEDEEQGRPFAPTFEQVSDLRLRGDFKGRRLGGVVKVEKR